MYNTTGVRKKKNKNTDFAYAGGKNAKICARKMVCVPTQGDMNTKLAYVRKKTCVRKDKNTAPGQNYGRIYLVLFTKPVLLTFANNRLQGT